VQIYERIIISKKKVKLLTDEVYYDILNQIRIIMFIFKNCFNDRGIFFLMEYGIHPLNNKIRDLYGK